MHRSGSVRRLCVMRISTVSYTNCTPSYIDNDRSRHLVVQVIRSLISFKGYKCLPCLGFSSQAGPQLVDSEKAGFFSLPPLFIRRSPPSTNHASHSLPSQIFAHLLLPCPSTHRTCLSLLAEASSQYVSSALNIHTAFPPTTTSHNTPTSSFCLLQHVSIQMHRS